MRDEIFVETDRKEVGASPINVSAYRPLFLYKLLSQREQVSLAEINEHFLAHPAIKRTFTAETLQKYLATLKAFGCRITRYEAQGQTYYRLEDHPLKLQSNPEEIQALKTMLTLLGQLPIKSVLTQFFLLMRRICHLAATPDLEADHYLHLLADTDLMKANRHRVEQFQQYCGEGQVLEIRYQGTDGTSTLLLVEPNQVIYQNKRLFLLGSDPKTSRKVRYDLERILSHRQLPSRIRTQTLKVMVTFKLTDRVALNYRPYPGEVVADKGEFLLVTHKTADVEHLLRRLLKYGPHCQVISPDWVRQDIKAMITQLRTGLEVSLSLASSDEANTTQTDAIQQIWPYFRDTPQTWGGAAAD